MATDEVYKSFKVLKEMLTDRGVDISSIENIETPELRLLLKQNSTSMIIELDINENFKVLYILSPKFSYKEISKYFIETKLNHVLIITKEKLSSANAKAFKSEDISHIEFEFFLIQNLQFNVSHHFLVNKHEKITDKNEIDTLMKTYRLKNKTQLNLILSEDPQARYLNIKPGDFVKITRYSTTAGLHYAYKYCSV